MCMYIKYLYIVVVSPSLHPPLSLPLPLHIYVHTLHRGEPYDKSLIHMVENVVIDWSRQVHDVLKKNSAQPLLEGKNPGPMVEIEFWDARRADLESVVDQLSAKKVVKMSHLLEKSLSSYYPAYKSMMDAIYNALDEARDIRYSVLC